LCKTFGKCNEVTLFFCRKVHPLPLTFNGG
jgi:hypothetical protein